MILDLSAELAVFFFVAAGLGSILRNIKFDDIFEELIIRLLFGVSIFPVIAIPLAAVSMLTPTAMCVIAVICILTSDLARWKMIAILKDKNIFGVLLMTTILVVSFYIGANSTVWLEDGDPNGHAVVASYIAHYSTYNKPTDLYIARYIEPYPVGYQLWMGMLSAIKGNVNNVLKIFNIIFIALTFPAFYYFIRRLYNNGTIALFATFVLISLPAFSTRFIFSQSLAMLQLVLAFYFIARVIKGENDMFVWAGLVIGALCLTHQTTGVVMGALFAIWVGVDSVYNKKINKYFIYALILGLVVASPWWGSQYQRYGWEKIKYQLNLGRLGETAFGLSDPNLRMYTLSDLVNVPLNNGMDNMTGFGIVVFICMILWVGSFLIYGVFIQRLKELEHGDYLMLFWLIFTGLALFSNWLPISFIPSRMWVYVSIPLAVITGVILTRLHTVKYEVIQAVAYLFIIGVILTSAAPKLIFNAGPWPNSRLASDDELKMAQFLYGLPIGTKVMDACYYERVWGYNLWDDPLDTSIIMLKNKAVNKTYGWDDEGWLKLNSKWDSQLLVGEPNEIGKVLKQHQYQYVIMGSKCMRIGSMDSEGLKSRIENMRNSMFDVAFRSGDEYILKVK